MVFKEKNMIKVKIDSSKCIGCGTCVSLCPERFEMNGNKAKVKEDDIECNCDLEDIIENCPVEAISKDE